MNQLQEVAHDAGTQETPRLPYKEYSASIPQVASLIKVFGLTQSDVTAYTNLAARHNDAYRRWEMVRRIAGAQVTGELVLKTPSPLFKDASLPYTGFEGYFPGLELAPKKIAYWLADAGAHIIKQMQTKYPLEAQTTLDFLINQNPDRHFTDKEIISAHRIGTESFVGLLTHLQNLWTCSRFKGEEEKAQYESFRRQVNAAVANAPTPHSTWDGETFTQFVSLPTNSYITSFIERDLSDQPMETGNSTILYERDQANSIELPPKLIEGLRFTADLGIFGVPVFRTMSDEIRVLEQAPHIVLRLPDIAP